MTPSVTSPVTTTGTVTAASLQSRLYLPLVSGGQEAEIAESEAVVGVDAAQQLVDEELLVDGDVSFLRQWSLDASYQGENRETFDKRIQMVIDANWLIERGFDPERLTLYTRASAEQPWERVPSVRYDLAQQAFIAQTGHFSEYGLGLDQGVVGEVLPDVSAFGTDLQSGAATVNYPINVPAGPGGMAPSLSLNYSTATVDSQRWDNNKNQSDGYRIQAGIAGIGWNLSTMSHIAFIDEGSDQYSTSDNRYSLVLNGTNNVFMHGQSVTESFAKIVPICRR